MEKEKAGLASELDRLSRELRAANAARELAEDRERSLSEQRAKDDTRVRALEERVKELLAHRAEIEKELQVARGALKNVDANVAALCAVQRRMRTSSGG